MRRHLHLQAGLNKLLRIVALVCTHCDFGVRVVRHLPGIAEHDLGSVALGVSISGAHQCADHQAVAVIAQGMAHVAQLTANLAFAIELRIRSGPGLMRIIAALVPPEVAAIVVALAAILSNKALVACPRLNQRAVHAEVLGRQPVFLLRKGKHLVEEFNHRIVLDQARPILGEDRGHPDCVVHRQPDEPAKQQVVLRLLHQLALGPDAVEHLQQHRSQQLLQRDARATTLDVGLIHPREQPIHLRQGLIDHGGESGTVDGTWAQNRPAAAW